MVIGQGNMQRRNNLRVNNNNINNNGNNNNNDNNNDDGGNTGNNGNNVNNGNNNQINNIFGNVGMHGFEEQVASVVEILGGNVSIADVRRHLLDSQSVQRTVEYFLDFENHHQ